jgi:hypothetical protein
MAQRETALRRVAAGRAQASAKSPPSLSKILALPSSSPKVTTSTDWLGPFIYVGLRDAAMTRLPADVRQAAAEYEAARHDVRKLSGRQTSELAAASEPTKR